MICEVAVTDHAWKSVADRVRMWDAPDYVDDMLIDEMVALALL